jgi:hypothetical protein
MALATVVVTCISRIAIPIILLAALALPSAERPIDTDREVREAATAMFQEMLAKWEVVESDQISAVYLASRAQQVEIAHGYCIRYVVRLARDSAGRIKPLLGQLEEIGPTDPPSLFPAFALSKSGELCESIPYERFFRVSSLNGLRPTIQLFGIMSTLTNRTWRSSTSPRYVMKYDDAVAERCLNSDRSLRILDVIERPGEPDATYHTIRFGGCLDRAKEFLVDVEVEMGVDGKVVQARSRSMSKAEFDCVRAECSRPDAR